MIAGESLFDEEKEVEDEEDEDYIDLLHSAAELDNPDYFNDSPDVPGGAPPSVDVIGDLAQDRRYLLQFYGSTAGGHSSGVHSPPDPVAPQTSPLYGTYHEALLGASNPLVPRSSSHPPRPMSRADNPLASPGMLFDRDLDSDVADEQIYARQLMSSLEDPLTMYRASFSKDEDMDPGFSPTNTSGNYSAGFSLLDGLQDGTASLRARDPHRLGF